LPARNRQMTGASRAGKAPDGQITENLSSPFRKNILIFRNPESVLYPHRPVPHRGALRNVTNAERDAVDADGAPDESA
jgi:hypothetical protein